MPLKETPQQRQMRLAEKKLRDARALALKFAEAEEAATTSSKTDEPTIPDISILDLELEPLNELTTFLDDMTAVPEDDRSTPSLPGPDDKEDETLEETVEDVDMEGTEQDLHPPSPFTYIPLPDRDPTAEESDLRPQKSQFYAPPTPESLNHDVDPVLAYNDPGVGNPEIPDQQDMRDDLTYQGQRQPPVGMRISHALNFLADEDIDRCVDWEKKVEEVEKFLLFAEANDKGNWAFADLGDNSKKMVEDGLSRVRAHRLFNKHHYGDHAEVRPLDPSSVPKPATRLVPVPGISIELAPKKNLDKERYPRHHLHRPETPVNQMYLDSEDRRAKREHYVPLIAQDEDAWFQLPSDQQPADKPLSNLSYIENKMYEDCSAANRGWVFGFQVDKGVKYWLPDGTPLNDSAEHFAKERGARRAGFQKALRAFTNEENRAAETPWRRLVLPLTAKEVEAAKAQATDRGLHPLGLAPTQLPKLASLETFPYTFWMEQYGRVHRLYSERARQKTIAEESHKRGWASLPSRDNAPYVFRGVDANTQYEQDMYPKMKTVIKLLEREEKIAPRPLLTAVMKSLKLGLNGEAAPSDLKFRSLDWKVRGKELKDLAEAELMWLKFLTQGSIHHRMIDELSPRAALYLNFADRLMRLMDDISETALWPDLETQVSVEDLLNKMHESLDGPIKKTQFYVHDALMWLDRLANAGRCRFQADPWAYGCVQRVVPDCHPEHLVIWRTRHSEELHPDLEDDQVGAPRRGKDVRTYPEAIQENTPGMALNPALVDWFCALAFRLGVQHRRIETVTAVKWVGLPEFSRRGLHESIQKWQLNWVQLAHAHDVPNVMDVVARAAPYDHVPGMTYQAALTKIRHGIISECVHNRDMLVPARVKRYANKDGLRMAVMVRPPLWDWAKTSVRGKSKQFFSLDRWPLNVQSQKTREKVETDKDLDPQQFWDPCVEDPCPIEWHRPKKVPYADQKVQYRWGPGLYPAGDTPLQKALIRETLTGTLAEALELQPNNPSFIQRVSGFFSRPPSRPAGQSTLLPAVDPALIPKSVDRRAVKDAEMKDAD